jgi:glycosyltransferase involved in cell wall biosynthesis
MNSSHSQLAAEAKTDGVSVVVPWGSSSVDLNKAIRSALSQTVTVHEVIVIANGRVTLSDLRLFRGSFDGDPVIFLHLPGCANANIARNIGIACAKSDYVAFLDADDWWCSSHLAESLAKLHSEDADLIYSGMRIYSSDNNFVISVAKDYRFFGNMESYLLERYPAPTPSFVGLRNALVQSLWDCSLRRHQDFEFIARFAKSHRITFKESVTVNVYWNAWPRLHQFHQDCFRVLSIWKANVSPFLYRRQFVDTYVRAKLSRDSSRFKFLPEYLYFRIYLIAIKLQKILSMRLG